MATWSRRWNSLSVPHSTADIFEAVLREGADELTLRREEGTLRTSKSTKASREQNGITCSTGTPAIADRSEGFPSVFFFIFSIFSFFVFPVYFLVFFSFSHRWAPPLPSS